MTRPDPSPDGLRSREQANEGTVSMSETVERLVKPCTCHPDDNPPVPCAQKSALTDCLRSELATLRTRVAELEAHKTPMPVSGDQMYCGKCNQWLADGRRLLWHPASGKYYCIGCDPTSPRPPKNDLRALGIWKIVLLWLAA